MLGKKSLIFGSSMRGSSALLLAALLGATSSSQARPLRSIGSSTVPINLGRKKTRPSKKTNAQLQRASIKARNRAKHKARA